MSGSLDVFVIAGEPSGDQLGAHLMDALATATGGAATFRGVGGPAMAARGLVSRFPMTDIALFGITSIIRHVPTILRRVKDTVAALAARPPDVLVLIDCPGFNRRVGRAIRKIKPDIPIVFYVSPTVWAWRPGRAKEMRPFVDRLLALFPFEPAVHERLGGPPTTYVGHPIAEKLALLRPNAEEAARREAEPPHLLVLPGSRKLEVTRLSSLFAEVLGRLGARIGPFEAVLPVVPHLEPLIRERVASWPVPIRLVTDDDGKWKAFRTARAALSCSGTVTLEVAVAGVPQVVCYRANPIEAAIAERLVTTDTAVLANHILSEKAVPEFLQRYATPEAVTTALVEVMGDTPARARQVAAIARLDEVMGFSGQDPSARAARAVLEVVGRSPS